MKKIFNLTLIAAVAFLATACHKDSTLTTMAPIGFTGSLKTSATTATLTANTDAASQATLTWPAITYPVKAQVTYSLQVDLPADTLGTTAWANAQTIAVGKDVLTKTLTGADLNTVAFALGIAPNATSKLVFRVAAYQDRYAYTNSVTISVTTFKLIIISNGYPVLYVPGDYQGWAPATAPTVASAQTGIYEGYINVPAGGSYQFKFTSAADWNHINYGDAGNGTLTVDGNAAGMTLPGAGYYELSINPSALTWTYTKTTWGIIGDATPGGWNTDTQLAYDATKQVWKVTCAMIAGGSFKFRANNAWVIDFGVNAAGKLAYADSPVYGYNGAINNITVPSSGNYTITLDIHDPNNYNYTAVKN
jgi:hypothetical protein